jgi:hypothetical protein
MGHRANYVLLEGSTSHIYFSRWGALSIPAVLLSGPEATIDYVRSLTPTDGLLDCVWAEGGLVVDQNRRLVKFFGGQEIERKPYLRRPLLKALRTLWVGWTIEWATFGIADLALSLGWDIHQVLDTEFDDERLFKNSDPLIDHKKISALNDRRVAPCIVTLRRSPSDVVDYLPHIPILHLLSLGPRLIEIADAMQTAPLPRESDEDAPFEGAYIEATTHTVWMWNYSELDPRHMEAFARRWPGWQIRGHVDGLARHVALSGRDPASVMVPWAEAVDKLADLLARFVIIDPLRLYDVLKTSGNHPAGDAQITVGNGFFSADLPPASPEEIGARLIHLLRDESPTSPSYSDMWND